MSRPPRIQAPGALYHITTRGNRRTAIFADEYDYAVWLAILEETAARFGLLVHVYCLMPNHFHLVVETPLGNISACMHYLNGKYFQYFNRKYKLTGHVTQGRFNDRLIQREVHLLELARYVVRNPVRARMVHEPGDWPWSSYRAYIGIVAVPAWLEVGWILGQFGNGPVQQHVAAYADFVRRGRGRPNPLRRPRVQRQTVAESAWAAHCANFPNQREAALHAYRASLFSIRAIAMHMKMSPRSLMRLLEQMEETDTAGDSGG